MGLPIIFQGALSILLVRLSVSLIKQKQAGKRGGLDPPQYLMQSSYSQHFTISLFVPKPSSRELPGLSMEASSFPTRADSGVSPQHSHIAFI